MKSILVIAALSATVASASMPEVSSVKMDQNAGRRVTITYKLSSTPAVVTVDIQTNEVSIGDSNLHYFLPMPDCDYYRLIHYNTMSL